MLGAVLTFGLAFASARNTTLLPWLRAPFRLLLGAPFALMLVIVVAAGFGPFAETLDFAVGSTGIFGRLLFADTVENIDARITLGLWASGPRLRPAHR